jgi:hypothetical protein
LTPNDAEQFAETEIPKQDMVADANCIYCSDSEIRWRRDGMDNERKMLVAFGIIVALGGIVIAVALVMNAMIG